MSIKVEDLKRSLRLLDDDVDEGQLQQLRDDLAAAESYVKRAVGVKEEFFTDPEIERTLKKAVLTVAAAYY